MENKELRKGKTLQSGKYTIERTCNWRGGFGITYYARHNGLGHHFAIKEFFISSYCMRNSLHKTVMLQGMDNAVYEKYLQKFIEEAQTLARLDHPNIVKVTDIFQENNTAYIVMPFVEGQTLQQLVEQKGKLDYETAVNYMAQIAEAVDYIHTRDILHRDIKPENIIITPENKAVLIDFGSAREFIHDKTQQHTSIYTQGYAPLEQYAASSRKGSYSDIYELGATFYFALTGEKPMDAATRTMETMAEPKALVPDIPEEANRTIMKAMQLKPEERQQKVGEFMGDLLNERVKPDKKAIKTKSTKYKKWKTPLIILTYIILYGVFVGVFIDRVDNYIWKKVSKLELEAKQSLKDFWKNQGTFIAGSSLVPNAGEFEHTAIIDTYYSNRTVKYTETNFLYSILSDTMTNILKYTKSFGIDPINDGWELFVAQQDGNALYTYKVYPTQVRYKRQTNSYIHDLIPSVQQCIDITYEFMTTNPQSGLVDCYKKGGKRMVDNFINEFGNEYYGLEYKTYSNYPFSILERTAGAQNVYLETELNLKDIRLYSIKEKQDKVDKDRKELYTNGGTIISCFFIMVIGIHVCFYRRKIKIKRNTMKAINSNSHKCENTAEEWLEKGKSSSVVWQITEGEERMGQKCHEEILSYYDKAIELSNDNTTLKEAWYYKGRQWKCISYMQDWDKCSCYKEAIKCYTESINLDANYAQAWYDKGSALDELERNTEAIECYDKAIQLDKNNDYYKVSKVLILFKMGKGQEAINLLLETKFDLLKKLSYIENNQDKESLTKSEKFEDDYFRKIMEENNTTDSTEKDRYRDIYAHSLLLISYLFVSSSEKIAHYTKKEIAQKLLFDDNSKFRLSMSTLSNDLKEGETLLDYLKLQREYIGNTILEPKGSNNNSVWEEYRAFIGCFSFNTECLNQFRLYGKDGEKEGTGVSMIFSNGSFPSPKTPTSSTDKYNSLLYRCMYLDSKTGRVVSIGHQEEYMRTMDDPEKNYLEKINALISNVQTKLDTLKEKITEELDKSIVSQLLINLRHLTKDVAFKEEQECRIIQILPLMDNRVKLREDYNQVYVEIDFSLLDLKKIIFGPKSTGMNLFQDILKKKGLLNINCEKSTLPLT